jgi:glycosyltransferase involved in cell wall biosynthesis
MLQQQIREVGASTPDVHVRVVVVDNDPAAGAIAVVDGREDEAITYVHEPKPGISAVRNRAIEMGETDDLLVMLDDDERPHEHWLIALIQTWRQTGAALVAGRVVAHYEGHLDPWVEAGAFFVRRNMPTGTPIEVAAAGNLLLDLRQVRCSGIRFENKFGLSGGEDNLFSRQLRQRGLKLVWCAESVVTDRVPAERMTRGWVLTRALSHGNTQALIDLELASNSIKRAAVRLRHVIGGVARNGCGLAVSGYGVLVGSLRYQARGLRMIMRGLGMLIGALGFTYQEYRRPGAR